MVIDGDDDDNDDFLCLEFMFSVPDRIVYCYTFLLNSSEFLTIILWCLFWPSIYTEIASLVAFSIVYFPV